MPTSTKSLKCPAWSEASCRLSVKLRSFRARSGSVSSRRSWRIAESPSVVVAVLRPPEPMTASFVRSEVIRVT